jgi:hypothetical protein
MDDSEQDFQRLTDKISDLEDAIWRAKFRAFFFGWTIGVVGAYVGMML